MSVFKSYDEMAPDQRAAYLLGRHSLRAGLEDSVMVALAERLISDLDAIEAERNMAVYERDARLVARAYLDVLARLVTPKESA